MPLRSCHIVIVRSHDFDENLKFHASILHMQALGTNFTDTDISDFPPLLDYGILKKVVDISENIPTSV